MSFSALRQRLNRTKFKNDDAQPVDNCNDSCPLLDGDETLRNNNKSTRIRDVRRIDNGALTAKKSLVQRIQSRKNRLIQRILVAGHLADPPKDQAFTQIRTCNRTEIEQLTTIRGRFYNHSQSVVDLSKATFCDSARVSNDDEMAVNICESSLAFRDQAEKCVLAKIDCRIAELKHIDSLIDNRAKLVLDVEYAKRTLILENQKGNSNRIAERKQALQAVQRDCEQATQFIKMQLKCLRSSQEAGRLVLFQEYALLAAQFFGNGAEMPIAHAESH